jgi:hypothetical protein
VEETALAVAALLGAPGAFPASHWTPACRGLKWLMEAVAAGRHTENAPIGFYFAKLWYHEALYPLVLTAAALGQAIHLWHPDLTHSQTGTPTVPDAAATGHRDSRETDPAPETRPGTMAD